MRRHANSQESQMNDIIKKQTQPIVRRLSKPVDTDLTSLIRRTPEKQYTHTEIFLLLCASFCFRRTPEKQYTYTEIFLLLCASFCFGVFAGIVLMQDRAQHGTTFASDWKASLLIPAFMMLAGVGLWIINDARKEK